MNLAPKWAREVALIALETQLLTLDYSRRQEDEDYRLRRLAIDRRIKELPRD